MPVTGVGGLFFRAKNPHALQQWYRDHLGVVLAEDAPWNQEAGPTMIMPFADDTDYFPVPLVAGSTGSQVHCRWDSSASFRMRQ